MDKENKKVLRELAKGTLIGEYTLELMKEEDNIPFKCVLEDIYKDYKKQLEDITSCYQKYFKGACGKLGMMNKKMLSMGIEHNLKKENSPSKKSEILIEGLNMGIIEGKKIENHKKLTEEVYKIVHKYIEFQEKDLEILKNYL